jgi:hypothetical protein
MGRSSGQDERRQREGTDMNLFSSVEPTETAANSALVRILG